MKNYSQLLKEEFDGFVSAGIKFDHSYEFSGVDNRNGSFTWTCTITSKDEWGKVVGSATATGRSKQEAKNNCSEIYYKTYFTGEIVEYPEIQDKELLDKTSNILKSDAELQTQLDQIDEHAEKLLRKIGLE